MSLKTLLRSCEEEKSWLRCLWAPLALTHESFEQWCVVSFWCLWLKSSCLVVFAWSSSERTDYFNSMRYRCEHWNPRPKTHSKLYVEKRCINAFFLFCLAKYFAYIYDGLHFASNHVNEQSAFLFLFKGTSFWCLAVVVVSLMSLETIESVESESGLRAHLLTAWLFSRSKRLSGVTECVKDFQCQTTLVPPAARFMPAVPGIKRHHGRLHATFLSPLTLQQQTFLSIHTVLTCPQMILLLSTF